MWYFIELNNLQSYLYRTYSYSKRSVEQFIKLSLENVLLPLQIYTNDLNDSYAKELLQFMGLSNRINHYPSELSGGERSRVAVARALVNKPALVLADEPSGNLDTDNAKKLIKLFEKINKEFEQSIVIATHDEKIASIGNKKFFLDKVIASFIWYVDCFMMPF